jgi:hypothetical protein
MYCTFEGRPCVIILDRALLDVSAYMPRELWLKVLKNANMTEEDILARYDMVLHHFAFEN